jgi:hypothetical protein
VRRLRFGLNSLASAFAFAGVLVEFGLRIAFVPAFSRSTQHFDDRGVVCVTTVIELQRRGLRLRAHLSMPCRHIQQKWRALAAKIRQMQCKNLVIDR